MKTIKFRAWHKKKEIMYPIVGLDWIKMACWLQDGDLDPRVAVWHSDMEKVELMQFTGLIDKNGKEIYEGDLLEANVGFGRFIAQVGFSIKQGVYPFMFQHEDKSEIIGNIYENPELLQP